MWLTKKKIKKFPDIEPHEIFWDKLAQRKEREIGIFQKKLEKPLEEKIPYLLFIIFLVLISFFFTRIINWQIIHGEELYKIAENNSTSISLIIPERGVIYDKNFKKLVSNTAIFNFVCEKSQFYLLTPEIKEEIKTISSLVGISDKDFIEKIRESEFPEVLIKENLEREKLLVLETKINDFKGCRIQQNIKRNYLQGLAFSHLLGYIGKISKEEYLNKKDYSITDYIGKTGIEKSYEDYLRGVPGKLKVTKTAIGKNKQSELILSPQPGKNLLLHIDADLQLKLYESLEKSIKNINAKKGSAIALDPRNGAVLALVSYPSFDNNLFSFGLSKEDYKKIEKEEAFLNRVIAGSYAVGSTIKPFEAIAALQEQIISSQKEIYDGGYIEIKNKYNPEIVYRFRGIKPHGWVDMKKAIAVSSNIYFYTIGGGYEKQEGLGPTRIKKYLELFGWGSKTGIDLPDEKEGFVPWPDWKKEKIGEPWWDGDTYNLSIGQSYLKVTPLQVAVAYSAIANGGILYKPQIVAKILDSSNKSINEIQPEIIRENFFKKEYIEVVKEGMRDCVRQNYGTAFSLNNLPVEVAAKTGTAQTSLEGYYNAWIALFAPYKNPEIVLVVLIENVEGLRPATIPVAYEVLDWYFKK